MLMLIVLFALLQGSLTAVGPDFCGHCTSVRKNQKDLYQDPDDCTAYVHCVPLGNFVFNPVRQRCPFGLFFDEAALTCVPWRPGTCIDPCLSPATQAAGTHGDPFNCNEYYTCINGTSVRNCCPSGQSWDQSTKTCIINATCSSVYHDFCLANVYPYATLHPVTVNGSSCIDEQGITRTAIANNSAAYLTLWNLTIPCALGTAFELATCSCSKFTSIVVSGPADLLLLIRFINETVFDESPNHFGVYCFQTVGLSPVLPTVISGQDASFNFNWVGDLSDLYHCEIPGTQSNEIGLQFSLMFFAKINCHSGGAIFSNKGIPEVELGTLEIYYVLSTVSIFFVTSTGNVTLSFPLAEADCFNYNHYAFIFGGRLVVYFNGAVVAQSGGQPIGGIFKFGNCPLVFGHDTAHGHMQGQLADIYASRVAQDSAFIQQRISLYQGFYA